MRAVNQLGYGDPHKVLRLDEVERPTPTDGQVLVRVVAASINAIDWRTVYAQPILVRLLGGLRPRRSRSTARWSPASASSSSARAVALALSPSRSRPRWGRT